MERGLGGSGGALGFKVDFFSEVCYNGKIGHSL